MKECNGLGDMNAINKIIVDSLRIDRFVFQNGEDPVTGVLFFKIERKEKNESHSPLPFVNKHPNDKND